MDEPVLPPATDFTVTPAQLAFTAALLGEAEPQTFTIEGTGSEIALTIATREPWLRAQPSSANVSANESAEIEVRVVPDGLAVGSYRGSISVQSADGQQTVGVTLQVTVESDPTLQVVLEPTRTSGVAPLSVFFETEGTQVMGTDNPFHDALYMWNFGDDGAGTWGPSGRSKNAASGPVAHHVFEQPGVYTTTLTVRDPEGRVATRSVDITVDDPDQVFAGSDTVCVSTSGNFDGCPSGAMEVTGNQFSNQIGAGRRVLLRRGEQWSSDNGWSIPGSASGGVLGAYGEGEAPRLSHSGGDGININGDDFRVMDLHFISTGELASGVGHGAVNSLTLRLQLDGYHFGYSEGADGGEGFAVIDSRIGPLHGGQGGNGAFLAGSYMAIQGNVFEDASDAEHTFRTPFVAHSVLSHNDFGPGAEGKHVLKLHAPNTDEYGIPFSERVVVSHNILRGGAGVTWMAVLGPQNDLEDEQVRDVIFSHNHLIAGPSTAVGLLLYASRITVRNNVADMSDAMVARCFQVDQRGIEPPPQDIAVYNNTCYSSGTEPELLVIREVASNIVASSNLAVSNGAGAPSVVDEGGATNVTDMANIGTSEPVFVVANPSSLEDFVLRSDSPAIDQGVQPPGAWDDPAGRTVAVDGNGDGERQYDVGAFEYGTP